MAVKCSRLACTNSSPSSGSSVAKTSLAPATSQAAIGHGHLVGAGRARGVGLDEEQRPGIPVEAHGL